MLSGLGGTHFILCVTGTPPFWGCGAGALVDTPVWGACACTVTNYYYYYFDVKPNGTARLAAPKILHIVFVLTGLRRTRKTRHPRNVSKKHTQLIHPAQHTHHIQQNTPPPKRSANKQRSVPRSMDYITFDRGRMDVDLPLMDIHACVCVYVCRHFSKVCFLLEEVFSLSALVFLHT